MKIFKNRKKENELLGKALGAAVKEAITLKEENQKLRNKCAEQEKRIQMLDGVRTSQNAEIERLHKDFNEVVSMKNSALDRNRRCIDREEQMEKKIEKLQAELKVRSGEVVTLKDLVERQGEDLQAARDTLRRVKNVLR